MIFNPYPNAFGLDIGDLSIKVVDLKNISGRKRTPKFRLNVARQTSIPPGLIVNGKIQSPEKIRTYILHLLEGTKGEKAIKGKWVVATIPEIHSFIKVIHVQKESKDVIDDDVLILARQHIPFDEESYYLDWQLLPAIIEQQPYTRVLIGATPKHIADMYTYLIESIGLGIIALEIEALAIARAMITSTKIYEGEARALLDVGATQSSLIVHDHDAIQFSKTIPFSGEVITTALTQGLKISEEDAVKLKLTYGVAYAKEYGEALGLIKQNVDSFVETIARSFQFYYSHFPNTNNITHITMSGGGTNMKQLPELLTERLGIECKAGKVWKNLGVKPGTLPDEGSSLGYATAVGLALRAADNPFRQYDMI
jgi:type IV pilus assembly protein PilM